MIYQKGQESRSREALAEERHLQRRKSNQAFFYQNKTAAPNDAKKSKYKKACKPRTVFVGGIHPTKIGFLGKYVILLYFESHTGY